MIFNAVFSIYDVLRSFFGYKSGPSVPAVRMVPQAAVTASPESIAPGVAPTSQDTPQASNEGHVTIDIQDWQSIRSVSSTQSLGNGASRKNGHAVLRGSPKALGWTIDETEEENAWVLLMNDAIHGSVHDVRANDEDVITSPLAPSNQDIIKFFASKEEPGVSYVWRIVPSLTGAHQWTLHRAAEAQPVPEETVYVEMQTETTDLVENSHQEAETQTTAKTYSEAAVQAEEPEPAVPSGALAPLPESTDLIDVLPADLRPVTPAEATTTVIDSRPGSPNSQTRIPRLASRRGSVTSFRTTSTRSTSPAPGSTRGPSPIPTPATQKIVRQAAASLRSMTLRRAGSKASVKPVPSEAQQVVDEARPVAVEAAGGLERKATGGRFFNAVKRIGRADSTVKSWKP